MTTVLETCTIPPTPGSGAELTVPLCFLDFIWLHFHSIRHLIFYDLPCSEAEFLETIVPNLKHSLSQTLKRYLPVAGNLLYPKDTDKQKPLIRYVSGDGIPLTVAISDRDFDDLAGNHARECDQFYEFLPPLPPSTEEEDFIIVHLIAVQATLFPGHGICIGSNNHHCLGDARSMAGFMWAWAEINKRGGDEEFPSSNGESLPSFDRSAFGDCSKTDDKFWNYFKNIPLKPLSFPLPTNRVRAAFTLHQSDITKLKNLAHSNNSELVHVSSFVVTAAYTWSTVLQSADAAGEEVGEDAYELFIFPADARGRPNALVDPPVPLNFFGNCLGSGMVKLKRKEAAGEGGFLAAAEAISNQIKNQVNDKEKFLNFSDDLMSEKAANFTKYSRFGVSGSPKSDFSNADFGWGKGRRVEVLSIDGEEYSMSLCNSWDSAGGLVIGLSLPRKRMRPLLLHFNMDSTFRFSFICGCDEVAETRLDLARVRPIRLTLYTLILH